MNYVRIQNREIQTDIKIVKRKTDNKVWAKLYLLGSLMHKRLRRYSSMISVFQHWMKVNSKLHASTASPPGK